MMNFVKLALGASAALVAGCAFQAHASSGGAPTDALPYNLTMRGSTSSGATLIYTTQYSSTSGVIYGYPGEAPQNYTIDPATDPRGLCSDSNGDVFLAGANGEVERYTYGATSPAAAVAIGSEIANANCAVDSATGDIAMVVTMKRSTKVAVLSKFTPPAKLYPPMYVPWSLTYDNKGNLFFLPEQFGKYLGELKKGANAFVQIPFSSALSFSDASFIQWDGKYLAITAVHGGRRQGYSHWIYRCKIAGGQVQLVSIVKPLSFLDPRDAHQVRTWIQSDRDLLISGQSATGLSVWAYPDARNKLAHVPGNLTNAVVAAPASTLQRGRDNSP